MRLEESPETLIEQELEKLIMDCPELLELETNLSQFNIYRVLRADRNELRHSNMLAWLFDPNETHGLGDAFLRRYLMAILRKSRGEMAPIGWVSPVVVDVLDVERVEVHREFDNIDLLFEIHQKEGLPWVICIENKVNSRQGKGQLERYRQRVEARFPGAERRLFIYLTKNLESPDIAQYMVSSYEDIYSVLSACFSDRLEVIGAEPAVLIRNFLRLIKDYFMSNNENVLLARKIYMQHRAALDFIFENKIDPMFEVSSLIQRALEEHARTLDIVTFSSTKSVVRFYPKAWGSDANLAGTCWGENSPIVLCEIALQPKKIELQIVAGDAPEEWADALWMRAAEPPFKQEWKQRPKRYIKPFKAGSPFSVAELASLDPEEAGDRFTTWLRGEIEGAKFRKAVEVIKEMLEDLPGSSG